MNNVKKMGLLVFMAMAFCFSANAMNIKELESKLDEAKQEEQEMERSLLTTAFGKYGRDPVKQKKEIVEKIALKHKEVERLEKELAKIPMNVRKNIKELESKLDEARQEEQEMERSLLTTAFGKYGRDPVKQKKEIVEKIALKHKEVERLEKELAKIPMVTQKTAPRTEITQEEEKGLTALFKKYLSNETEAVQDEMIQKIKNLNLSPDYKFKYEEYWKPRDGYLIHMACHRHAPKLTEFLLKGGANVNAETNKKKTPIFYAIASGSLPCVKLLLNNNPKANIEARLTKEENTDTPLLFAIRAENARLLEIQENGKSKRPNMLEIIKYLVETGKANVYAKDSEQMGAIEIFSDELNPDVKAKSEVYKYLLSKFGRAKPAPAPFKRNVIEM